MIESNCVANESIIDSLFWRFKMIKIDIDRLLEQTSDLKADKNELKVKKLEIDKILENTENR
jgi:hypothetical protein